MNKVKRQRRSDLQYLEHFKRYLGFQYAYSGKIVRGNSLFQYNGLVEMNNFFKRRLIDTILRILNSKIGLLHKSIEYAIVRSHYNLDARTKTSTNILL